MRDSGNAISVAPMLTPPRRFFLRGLISGFLAASIFFDKDGHKREEVRLRWWDRGATTFKTAAIGLEGREDELPDSDLPVDYSYRGNKPVFFGHYWLSDAPKLTSSNAACLDFSVAKKGYLTAYRWSGETELKESSLISVLADP